MYYPLNVVMFSTVTFLLQLILLLSDDYLLVESELDIFYAIIRWVNYDYQVLHEKRYNLQLRRIIIAYLIRC